MRIQKLAELFDSESAALITSEENRRYFTGFNASSGYLLVTRQGGTFITDSRYIEAAQQSIVGCDVLLEDKYAEQIVEILEAQGIRRLFIEATKVSVMGAAKYRDTFSSVELVYTDELDAHIKEFRKVKSEEEKEKIIRAQRIAEAAFEKVLHIIKPGVLERDVAAELEYLMRKGGAEGVSFDTIVVTGANSSKPHGVPGDTPIASGDFVTIDFGAIYDGYHSDTTRTVAVGDVSPEMAHVYDTVLTAQLAGVRGAKAGVTAADTDALCRDIITDAGYGDYFGHGTGHGVGVEIHEAPTVSPRSTETLQLGNVITIEPGIYLPGKFGVRIEDMLYITEDSAENLVTLPKELIVLG